MSEDNSAVEHAERLRLKIAADTSDRAQIALAWDEGRGFSAAAYDGPGRSAGDIMAAGPWRPTAVGAIDELAAEWARGCE